MTKPTVTITISGVAGSGKTVLAQWLANQLIIEDVVEVTLQDEGQKRLVDTRYTILPENFSPLVNIVVEQK